MPLSASQSATIDQSIGRYFEMMASYASGEPFTKTEITSLKSTVSDAVTNDQSVVSLVSQVGDELDIGCDMTIGTCHPTAHPVSFYIPRLFQIARIAISPQSPIGYHSHSPTTMSEVTNDEIIDRCIATETDAMVGHLSSVRRDKVIQGLTEISKAAKKDPTVLELLRKADDRSTVEMLASAYRSDDITPPLNALSGVFIASIDGKPQTSSVFAYELDEGYWQKWDPPLEVNLKSQAIQRWTGRHGQPASSG